MNRIRSPLDDRGRRALALNCVKEEYNTERGRATELILLSGIGTAAFLAAEPCELCAGFFERHATNRTPLPAARATVRVGRTVTNR